MMEKLLERVVIPLMRWLLHAFFRHIEIEHAERIPAHAPLVFTPNHANSLIDGILVRVFLPRDPRSLAKATLWKNPFFRPLLVASHSIPVYRQQDADETNRSEKNRDMFDECYSVLAQKACIVIFPEGMSHDEPELQPLKTGTARIVLGAEQRFGPLGTRIVPVGLTFDAKQKFRSRVLISIGEPFDPMDGLAAADPEDRQAVAKLTERIKQGISAVTLNYPSWEEAQFIRRAAELYVRQMDATDDAPQLSEKFPLHKQLADAYLALKTSRPRMATRMIEAVTAYDRLLRILSIKHRHVVQDQPDLTRAIYGLRKLSLFLVRLPLALLGVVFNAAPFYLTRWASRLQPRSDRISTVKIIAGSLLFPLCWLVQALLLGQGFLPVFLWWCLGPLSGAAALLFMERHSQVWEELRAYLRHNNVAEIRQELDERLHNVKVEVAELLEAGKVTSTQRLQQNAD